MEFLKLFGNCVLAIGLLILLGYAPFL